jgi:DNA-binding NtrC family response regulator
MAVIFSSGHGTERQLAASFDDHRTRYLQKPFEIAALLDAIASVEVAL